MKKNKNPKLKLMINKKQNKNHNLILMINKKMNKNHKLKLTSNKKKNHNLIFLQMMDMILVFKTIMIDM